MEAKSRQTNDDELLPPGCYWSTQQKVRLKRGMKAGEVQGLNVGFQQVILTIKVYKRDW